MFDYFISNITIKKKGYQIKKFLFLSISIPLQFFNKLYLRTRTFLMYIDVKLCNNIKVYSLFPKVCNLNSQRKHNFLITVYAIQKYAITSYTQDRKHSRNIKTSHFGNSFNVIHFLMLTYIYVVRTEHFMSCADRKFAGRIFL